MRRIINQRGETIVEVLVAIAVISAVLASAYAIVSRNTRNYQQVNEHTEALKLAETQLERIRQVAFGTDEVAKENKTKIFVTYTEFCVDATLLASPQPCEEGLDSRYTIEVVRTGTDRFESVVTWDGINGGTDRVSLSYRVQQ